MTETQPEPKAAAQPEEIKKPAPTIDDTSFRDMLAEHLGKIFMIANPESLEETAIGHEITTGWYRAKLVGMGSDYLTVITEFSHGSGKRAVKEPVKQFIPLQRIKRISLMKAERLIHI